MLQVGDKVRTKKPHPCGCDKWEIVRTGIDYKLKCLQCGHIVIIDSQKLNKMIKGKIDD